jgi:uncharacterized protein YprB with RNaseH-like and TPR domain
MPAPVYKLKKSEIIWLSRNRCKHGHTYLDHYSCFEKEKPDMMRIGFLDIEASNLKANYGVILTWAIKKKNGPVLHDKITKKDINKGTYDKRIVKSLVKAMGQFDLIVTYYGTGYDLPFIRTRAVHHDIDFFNYGEINHKDVYYIIRNKFQLNRSSMENACRFLLGETDKTHIDFEYWLKALKGDKESIEYILDHNIKDVQDLEKLYNKVHSFNRPSNTSI